MIRVLIADDETHARDRLKGLLEKYDFINVECEAKDGDEALQMIISRKPDVAFLDINMPGISVMQSVASLKEPPLIVFQTAYSEHAVNAFGLNALDYLLKPLTDERLSQTIDKIKNALNEKTGRAAGSDPVAMKKISVRDGSKIRIIAPADIYKITFEEGFSFIYTPDGRFLSEKYLNEFEELLKDSDFFRTSRSDIVNLKYIVSIHPMFHGSYSIELKNKIFVDLSRRRAKELRRIIDF